MEERLFLGIPAAHPMRKTSLFFPNSGTTATSNPSANSWKKHWKTWKINSFSWQQLLIVSFHNFPAFPGGIFPLNLAFPTRLCACTPRMRKNSLVQTVLGQHSQGNVPVLPIPYQNPSVPQEVLSCWISHGIQPRSIFLLYPCAHPLPQAREGQQFPSF